MMKNIHKKFLYSTIGFLIISNIVIGIGHRSLNGDEYGSIRESINLGLNWNGIGYFSLMHFWIQLSDNEIWLRLPSILFGLLSIVFICLSLNQISGSRSVVYAMLIVGTSPFLASCSQLVRFYSFFLFITALNIWASIRLIFFPNRKSWIVWGISVFLLPFSHFLGALVVFASCVSVYVARKAKRSLMILGGGGIALVFLIPLIPGVIDLAWKVFSIIGASPSTTQARITPITLINLVKLGFAGYTYFFGYNTYPLDLWFVVPGILSVICAVIIGIANTFDQKTSLIWQVILVYNLILFVGAYTVLDSIGGRLASGVSPRHAAFIWPVLMILIGVGFRFPSRLTKTMLVGMIMVNILGNYERITSEWSYEVNINYKSAYEAIEKEMNVGDWVVYDGRSQDSAAYYLRRERAGNYVYKNFGDVKVNHEDLAILPDQILVLSNDYRSQIYDQTNLKILEISKAYTLKNLWVEYPFFALLYKKAEWSETGIRQLGENVELPFQIYGLEFQDLVLPMNPENIEKANTVKTSYLLAPSETIRIALMDKETQYHTFTLVSNIIPAPSLKKGDSVIALTLDGDSASTLNLSFGNEIESWTNICQLNDNCDTVFSWRKRVALLGQYAYPGSWNDFSANVHKTSVLLDENPKLENITIQNITPDTNIYLWGLFVK